MTQIAVLGYGTVGSGVVEVLKTNHESISKKAGQEINIKYVLDLRDFPEAYGKRRLIRQEISMVFKIWVLLYFQN